MLRRRAIVRGGLAALLAGIPPTRAQTGGRTVTVASGNDMTGISAIDAWISVPDVGIIEHMSDSLLMRWHSDVVGPCLAQSWHLVDDVTWEYRLRPGVEFHNGEKMTAECFKLFFDLVLNPETRSNLRATHVHVKEVQVLDDLQFRVIAKAPTPAAVNAMVTAYPIPLEYFKAVGLAGYRRRPVGTGAYRFVERIPDSRLVMTAFDRYWGGRQLYDRIVYRPIAEASSRAAALLAGEIDIALDLPPELVGMVKARPGFDVRTQLTNRVMVLSMDFSRPELPTSKPQVREALNYAIDRDSLARDVMDGFAEPVAFASPSAFGYDPSNPPIKQDLARARRLLAEAGYPNGIDLDFETPNGRYLKDKETAEAIAGQVAAAGIRLNVRPLEWGLMQRRMYSGNTAPVFLSAFSFSGDVYNYNINNLRTGGTSVGGSSPELDANLDASAAEMNPDRRRALIVQQQAIMNRLYPKAFLIRLAAVAGVGPNAGAWRPRVDERIRIFSNAVLG